MKIDEIIKLSDLLAELVTVKRATKLPNGENESDSHHSFSLALIAYHICQSQKIDVDITKVILYALVHDLLEVITGDEDTLHYTADQHRLKHEREKQALSEFEDVFKRYPELTNAMYEYERLDSPEAATVFVLDKACTTWTHHHDNAAHAKGDRDIHSKKDVEAWAERQRQKFAVRLNSAAPTQIMQVYEESFEALKDLYES